MPSKYGPAIGMSKFIGIVLTCVLLIALLSGCIRSESSLCGGIVVTFEVNGEMYNVFTTNEDTIEEAFAAQRGESQATIPSGKLVEGSKCYNLPWSWHIDPQDVHMAESTIALCDGLPSHVEDNLDYWIDTVGRLCPWSATIVHIEDYR